jgi:hypothetical protein
MKVILKRGFHSRGDTQFPEESKSRAWQRARSLSWLHGDVEPKVEGNTIVIDASKYYSEKPEKVQQ